VSLENRNGFVVNEPADLTLHLGWSLTAFHQWMREIDLFWMNHRLNLIEQGHLLVAGTPMIFYILRSSLTVRIGGAIVGVSYVQVIIFIKQDVQVAQCFPASSHLSLLVILP
jgi:hypothetical protein